MRHSAGTALTALLGAILLGAGLWAGSALGQAQKFPALGPLPPVPVPRDNPMSDAKVELGRLLFFDPRLSGDASTSCASCHNPHAPRVSFLRLPSGVPGLKRP